MVHDSDYEKRKLEIERRLAEIKLDPTKLANFPNTEIFALKNLRR